MRKDSTGKVFFALAVVAFWLAGASAVHAQPLLVAQPAYSGMTFYVQQPHGISPNWFTTFDGYPVWKGADGVWFYGSYADNTLVQTNYVVGAVVPSVMGIIPYVTAAPGAVVVPVGYVPACAGLDFMQLGDWRRGVDRVGILAKPSIPVAWRGSRPDMIYAWTGTQWYQLTANEGDRPGDVLRENLYLLTRLVHQNGNPEWTMSDVGFLTAQTARWGYVWMGTVGPNPSKVF